MERSRRRNDDNPARLYLASIGQGSQWGMRQALETIAQFLSDDRHDAESFPWWEVRYRDSAAVRTFLAKRYKPATVNKMLSALRGVLKQSWRLGYMDADTYQRAADVENLRGSTVPRGRALAGGELAQLFGACTADATPRGTRDAAMLSVFYGCGVRRGELARLEVEDFRPEDCSIIVRHGKRRKQRTVYLSECGCRHVKAWLGDRGDAPGPLFCPVSQTGDVRIRPLRGESIAYILRRRQEQAGSAPFSPHDLRRSFVTKLLDAGEDVFTVQKLAGHADVSTTVRYDRRDETAKRRAVRHLHIPEAR